MYSADFCQCYHLTSNCIFITIVFSCYSPQTGMTEAEKQDFRDGVEKMIGLVEVVTMLCVVR